MYNQGGPTPLSTRAWEAEPFLHAAEEGCGRGTADDVEIRIPEVALKRVHSVQPPLPPCVANAQRLSMTRLLGLCAVCFGYGMALTTYALITFPAEAVRFFPAAYDLGLAAFLILAGVAQLSGPAVGFFSDRCRSRFGRRRPYLVASWAVLVPAVCVQWVCSANLSYGTAAVTAYYTATLLGMLALCAMLTAAQGLIPDFVPHQQTGQANGALVLMLGLGAATGFGIVIRFPQTPLYPCYLVVLSTSTLLTVRAASGDGSARDDVSCRMLEPCSAAPPPEWTWADLRACYWVDRKEYPDFFWLFVSRMFYYMGVSAQSFLQYYLRDWVHLGGVPLSLAEARMYTAVAAFVAQAGAAIVAIPVGQLSDRPGVGRKDPVTWACLGVAACQVLYITCQDLSVVMLVAFLYGICNGAALALTYSLAVDCLPCRSQAAKWLAVWDVATFVGTTIGPVICGPTLLLFPMPAAEQAAATLLPYRPNAHGGYVTVMVSSGVFVALSALTIRCRVRADAAGSSPCELTVSRSAREWLR